MSPAALRDNGSTITNFNFAVTDQQIFWTYGAVQTGSQYIFSAPLPAQPCDVELPCTASETCDRGFCTPGPTALAAPGTPSEGN